eukprot:41404-Alexandrium_andersonii.AAC.1
MGIREGDPARCAKGLYGLIKGPRIWLVDNVFKTFRENGWDQAVTDPCLWRLFEPTPGGGQRLVALMLVHIDDFLLAGDEDSALWQEQREKIRQMWEWTDWETGSFKITG